MNLDIANMVLNIEQQSSKDLIDILSALLTPVSQPLLDILLINNGKQMKEKENKIYLKNDIITYICQF